MSWRSGAQLATALVLSLYSLPLWADMIIDIPTEPSPAAQLTCFISVLGGLLALSGLGWPSGEELTPKQKRKAWLALGVIWVIAAAHQAILFFADLYDRSVLGWLCLGLMLIALPIQGLELARRRSLARPGRALLWGLVYGALIWAGYFLFIEIGTPDWKRGIPPKETINTEVEF